MSVTESLKALGTWSLKLRADTPKEIVQQLEYLGHVTVHTGRLDPRTIGDSLLASSRYTGVLRGLESADDGHSLSGAGMAFWLGDEDGKGDVYETALTFSAADFTTVIAALLPASGAVTAGTLHPIVGTYSGSHLYQDPRTAIAYVCDTMGAEWRVNGDATLDAGTEADLFVTDPQAAVVRRDAGVDMRLRAFSGSAGVTIDVEDFSTRVVLLAENEGDSVATGSADIDPGLNVYKDIHGNPVVLTRLESESQTSAGNADARAQLQLNRFTSTRDALSLSTPDYDIRGTAAVGDYVWVHDPDIGLYNHDNEVVFRGTRMYPVKLRVTELTWPVVDGSTVAYRDGDGNWLDLTSYVEWETDQTTITVGGFSRSLTDSGGEAPSSRPKPDLSVPDVVEWVTPFRLGVYQSTVSGEARGEVILTWFRPLNTDGSTIVDGSHYEIRYRRATTPIYPITYDALMALGRTYAGWEATIPAPTYASPISYPETEWQTAVAPFDVETFRLQELVPAMPYEAQIRAVDLASPSNIGAWSVLTNWVTTSDDIPPSTPAAPTIAANPMAVQMTHNLGASTGGTFNLERDLHHLELHRGNDKFFTPDSATLIGKVLANYGMMATQVPVVQTFTLKEITAGWFKVIAVDEAGNKSLASTSVQRTADLISNQYISDLTASKITAGNITADWFVGSDITGGAIHVIGDAGIDVTGGGDVKIHDGALIVFNANGNKIVEVGECADGRHGVQVYKDNGTRVARMGELASGSEGIEVINDLGQLVRVDTLAFGMQAASVATKQARSGGYGDLATFGPSVNVTIGNSGRCVVLLSGGIEPGVLGGGNAAIGFDMSGPGYTRSASVFESMWFAILGDNVITETSATKAILVSGLPTAGTYTVTMKYWTAGASHSFFDRHLIVIPF